MKIAILVAMDKELNLLLPIIENLKEVDTDGIIVYHGNIGIHEVYATKCGIGKVNASINTLKVIYSVKPDHIINTGVAGGAGLSIPIGGLLIATTAAYHDVWCGPGTTHGVADNCPDFFTADKNIVDLARLLLKNNNVAYGLICSGDQFISTHEEIVHIRKLFPDVLAVDMESAAIAQTCYLENIPFNVFRVVSDTPGEGENISQYSNFWNDAPATTFSVLKLILKNL